MPYSGTMMKLSALKSRETIKILISILIIVILVFFPDLFFFLKNRVYNYALTGVVIVTVLLLVPVVLFFYNLRIYYWILAFIASLLPLAILPVILVNSLPNSEMLGLVLETNSHEASELLGWKIFLMPVVMILIFLLVLKVSKGLPSKINFKKAALISLISLAAFLSIPFLRTFSITYYAPTIRNTFKAYYPFRIGNAISYLSEQLKNVENYNKNVANFSFGAKQTINDTARKITVLIIGETARYDHFSVNGYSRETSPFLEKQQNLITFSDAASGGSMTHLSIPLIITRADATDYDLHKKERSILKAYSECGYKTFWISNQSKYGLAGNIGMHYSDADTTIFNGWGANDNNYTGNYDSALIPAIKNVMEIHKNNNIFMLVHTIGSHWRYLLRYPPEFTKFKPVSDRNRNLIGYPPDNIMINEYDNSILYTDYIINQIIETVKAENAEATIAYVSDHGENLHDDNRNLYFHSYTPTKYTTHVPLFFWLSDSYIQKFPEKYENMKAHKAYPVSSAANMFYTLLDLSHIDIKNNNKAKSIASETFTGDPQKVIAENSTIVSFKDLK